MGWNLLLHWNFGFQVSQTNNFIEKNAGVFQLRRNFQLIEILELPRRPHADGHDQLAGLHEAARQVAGDAAELFHGHTIIPEKRTPGSHHSRRAKLRVQQAHEARGQKKQNVEAGHDRALLHRVGKGCYRSGLAGAGKGCHGQTAHGTGQHIAAGEHQNLTARQLRPEAEAGQEITAGHDDREGSRIGILQDLQLLFSRLPGGQGVRRIQQTVQVDAAGHQHRNQHVNDAPEAVARAELSA